jgi:hypothetical protein
VRLPRAFNHGSRDDREPQATPSQPISSLASRERLTGLPTPSGDARSGPAFRP